MSYEKVANIRMKVQHLGIQVQFMPILFSENVSFLLRSFPKDEHFCFKDSRGLLPLLLIIQIFFFHLMANNKGLILPGNFLQCNLQTFCTSRVWYKPRKWWRRLRDRKMRVKTYPIKSKLISTMLKVDKGPLWIPYPYSKNTSWKVFFIPLLVF